MSAELKGWAQSFSGEEMNGQWHPSERTQRAAAIGAENGNEKGTSGVWEGACRVPVGARGNVRTSLEEHRPAGMMASSLGAALMLAALASSSRSLTSSRVSEGVRNTRGRIYPGGRDAREDDLHKDRANGRAPDVSPAGDGAALADGERRQLGTRDLAGRAARVPPGCCRAWP